MELPLKNCQFFGALTYTVVLNNLNHQSLTEDALNTIVNDLQRHLYSHIRDQSQIGANLVIIKKLLSNLSLLFSKSPKLYQNPITTLLGVILSVNNLPVEAGLSSIIESLPLIHIDLLLTFFSILVEDVSKESEEKNTNIHQVIYDFAFNDYKLILTYLQNSFSSLPLDSRLLVLDTINSWVSYISVAESNSTIRYNDTNLLIEILLNCLVVVPYDKEINETSLNLASKALVVLTEIVEINPSMLKPETKKIITSILFEQNQWGINFINSVIFNEENRNLYSDEANNFVNLVIVYLQMDLLKFSKNILDPKYQHIISILIKLTDVPGIPIEDETISELLLAFWEELASIFVDDSETFDVLFESSSIPNFKESFNNEKQKIFDEVCRIYWLKIHLPDISTLAGIRSEFVHYRQNVADFFIVIYSLLSTPFYENLTSGLITSLDNLKQDLNPVTLVDVESTLYLLYKVTDDSTFYESQSSVLVPFTNSVFSNNLLAGFKNLPLDNMNTYYHSSLVNYLSSVQFYLKTDLGKSYLGDIFDLLFMIMMKSSGVASLASLSLMTSKTILKICQECRSNLTEFLPNFELVLVDMLKDYTVDHLIRQRMFHSYTSIAQCIKDPQAFAGNLYRMISAINEQCTLVINGTPLNEEQQEYLTSLLSCIVEIGKGCQLPDEPDEIYSKEEQNAVDLYWSQDPLQIRSLVLSIINQFSLKYAPFVQNQFITEKCCLILKCGLGEPLYGPFKFDNLTIFQYVITKMDILSDINSVTFIYSLVETVIITDFHNLNDQMINELISNIFTSKLEFIKSDPDLIKSSIDLFATVIEKKPSLIIDLPIFFDVILYFAIEGLNANETFIIKSVVKFWTVLTALKKGSRVDQEKIQTVIGLENNISKLLVHNLFKSFLASSRSNLEYYYPAFRQLIGKYPMIFKKLVFETLSDDNLGIKQDRIDEQVKTAFVNKLMITRGHRAANDVLKNFWLSANGLIDFHS